MDSAAATTILPHIPIPRTWRPLHSAPQPAYPSWPAVTASDPLAQCQNPISPAILILQQLQNGLGAGSATGAATTEYNWLPINFYDAREGEPRDSRPAGDTETSCSPIGVMNVVAPRRRQSIAITQGSGPYAGGSGKLVSITDQNGANENGYLLYFSDHRGMLPDAQPLAVFYNNISGMSGLNDTVNRNSQTGVPDGVLEPLSYYPYSPKIPARKRTASSTNGVSQIWEPASALRPQTWRSLITSAVRSPESPVAPRRRSGTWLPDRGTPCG